MGVFGAILSLIFLVFIVYLISRVAHFFNDTRNRLNDIDKKLEEIKQDISTNE